jgi:hypothetical protein
MNKRIEFLLSKNQDLSLETILSLSELDPTKELKYLTWIINRYKKDGLLSSDFFTIKNLLTSFDENKNSFPTDKKDINSFKSVLQLSIFLFEFEKNKKIDENKFLEQGAIKLYEDSNLLLVKPFTKESAIKFGKTTTWCTSALEDNRFYNYLAVGDLFILINKKKLENCDDKKIQFFFPFDGSYSEFRDSSNSEIDAVKMFKENKFIFDTLIKYKSVQQVVNKSVDFFYFTENPTKGQILNALKHDLEIFCDLKEVDEEMQVLYFNLYTKEKKSEYTVHAFNNILKKTNPCDEVRKLAIEKYPEIIILIQQELGDLTVKEQVIALELNSKLIYDIKSPCENAIAQTLELEPEYIFEISNPTEEQIKTASVNKEGLLIKYINKNKLDPKSLVDVIFEVCQYDLKVFKKYHKLLHEYHLMELIKDCPSYIQYINNPSEKIQEIAVKSDYSVFHLIKNPGVLIEELYQKEKETNQIIINKPYIHHTYNDSYKNLSHFVDDYYFDADKLLKNLYYKNSSDSVDYGSEIHNFIKKYLQSI